MTNANTFHSMIYVLLIAAALYFIAMGIFTLKDRIEKKKRQKKEKED